MENYKDITMALAGVYQSVGQVIRLAKTGRCDDISMEPLIESVLKLDSDNCESVYGSVSNIKPGIKLLKQSLEVGASGKSIDMGRYVATILSLERKLSQSTQLQNIISNRVESIQNKQDLQNSELDDQRIPIFDTAIIHEFAELYKNTISTLPIRLHISGEEHYLKRPDVQDKVRCYLLCAIRSAVLWRQMGGKRRQLILKRKLLVRVATNLLHSRD